MIQMNYLGPCDKVQDNDLVSLTRYYLTCLLQGSGSMTGAVGGRIHGIPGPQVATLCSSPSASHLKQGGVSLLWS